MFLNLVALDKVWSVKTEHKKLAKESLENKSNTEKDLHKNYLEKGLRKTQYRENLMNNIQQLLQSHLQ